MSSDDLIRDMARAHYKRRRDLCNPNLLPWERLSARQAEGEVDAMRAAYERLPGNIKDQLEAMHGAADVQHD